MKRKRYVQSKRDRFLFSGAVISAVMAAGIAFLGDYSRAAIVGALSLFAFASVFVSPDEPDGADSGTYAEMIERLAQMGKSLGDLSAFLERERERVAETERTVEELQKEKEELEPVVSTQRQVVDAILAAHAARGRASAWKNRIVGFSIGVLSSLIATFIWDVLA